MNTLNDLKEMWSGFWMARNARERMALMLAFFIIALTLVYLLGIEPAMTGRAQLEKNVPALRQQVAELQALSKQAMALANVNGENGTNGSNIPNLTKESIESSLTNKGLKSQDLVLTGEFIKVQLPSTSFANMVSWLDEMQKTARLSVVEGNIEALNTVDTVRAALTLRQQQHERKSE